MITEKTTVEQMEKEINELGSFIHNNDTKEIFEKMGNVVLGLLSVAHKADGRKNKRAKKNAIDLANKFATAMQDIGNYDLYSCDNTMSAIVNNLPMDKDVATGFCIDN